MSVVQLQTIFGFHVVKGKKKRVSGLMMVDTSSMIYVTLELLIIKGPSKNLLLLLFICGSKESKGKKILFSFCV